MWINRQGKQITQDEAAELLSDPAQLVIKEDVVHLTTDVYHVYKTEFLPFTDANTPAFQTVITLHDRRVMPHASEGDALAWHESEVAKARQIAAHNGLFETSEHPAA